MNRDYKLFIQDIVEAINDIEIFIGDIDFDTFLQNKKTMKAVV